MKKISNKPQILNLIDGVFSPKDSREILISFFSSKINFHKLKNFSSQEVFGKEDKLAAKKIPQLKKSLAKLLEIIEAAEKEDKHLTIRSEVMMSLVENKKNV